MKPRADHPRQAGGIQSRPRLDRSQTLIAGECSRSGYGGIDSAPQGGCGPAASEVPPRRTAGQPAIKATATANERVLVTDPTLALGIESYTCQVGLRAARLSRVRSSSRIHLVPGAGRAIWRWETINRIRWTRRRLQRPRPCVAAEVAVSAGRVSTGSGPLGNALRERAGRGASDSHSVRFFVKCRWPCLPRTKT